MNAERIKHIGSSIALVVMAGLLVGLGAGVAPARAGDEAEGAELPSTRVVGPRDPIRDEPLAAPPLSPQPGVVAQTVHDYEPWFSYRNNTGQTLDRLDLYVALTPDRDNQTLTHFSFSDPYELLIDRYGQQVAHFRWSDIAPDEVVGVSWEWTAQVSTLYYNVDPNQVGDLDDIPADIRALYTEKGSMYRLESPIIRDAAAQAVQGVNGLYDRAYSIFRVVRDRLTYDQDGRWDDAETVYLQRHGSCTEHAWLYIALCRANGIPARYVGGMMSMSVNHRWAEIYLPPYGWVPVDPTWNRFGVAPDSVMVTTVGGGGSEYLDWTYNWLEWKDRPDVFLSPLTQADSGLPGAWVKHEIDVHNETSAADSFDLSHSGSSWQTELSHASTGELASGASFRLTVRVRVPDTPTDGDQDTATIHAVSSSDPGSKAGSATVTTVADVPPEIEVSPTALGSVQPPGTTTTHALNLHNLSTSKLFFSIHQALPLNAVLLLSLNETGGAQLFLDGSGHGNHATCSGTSCPDSNAWSPRGWAAEFDGLEDRIVTPVNLDQSPDSPGATMAAWVYPTSSGAGLHHVLSTDDGGHDWSILHENGTWAFFDGEGRRHTSFAVDLNRWQHVAAVFKPGEGVAFYKNGQGEHFSTLGYDESSENVVLGDNAGPWPEFFKGKIDEVQVYEVPLKPLQVYHLAKESDKASWLSWDVDDAYGRVQGLDTRAIQVVLDATGLSLGTYTAQVSVISTDPDRSRVNVPVTMVIADPAPEISVQPASFDETLDQGTTLDRTLTISNTGTAALEFELSTVDPPAPWLATDPVSGTVSAGGAREIQLTLDASEVEPGAYHTQLQVASNDPLTPTLDIPVTMTVQEVVPDQFTIYLPLVMKPH